jgi:hypothetical protein
MSSGMKEPLLLEGIDIGIDKLDELDELVDELERKLNESRGNNLLINIGDIVKKILLLITTNCNNYINEKFNNKLILKSHFRCEQSKQIHTLYKLLQKDGKDGLEKDGLEQKKQEVYRLLIEISSKEKEKNIIELMLLNSKKREEMYKSLEDNDDNILKIINIDDNDNYLYIVYNTINIYNKLCENGIILSEIEPRAKEPSKNIKTIFKDIKKEYFVTHKKSIMCMIAVEYIKEMVLIMNSLIDNERLSHLIATLKATLNDFTEMRKKYEKYINENNISIEVLQNGGNAKVTKINKKEILGRERCIYKKPGDRKEYLKHKGELITVKDYKKRMKDKK